MKKNTKSHAKLQGQFQKIARAMSRNWDILVEPSGSRCCTDGSTIRYPFNADYLDGANKKSLHGLLDHEVSHVAEEREHKENGQIKPLTIAKNAKNKKQKMFFNVFEDIRIETKYSEKYIGMGENLHQSNLGSASRFAERFRNPVEANKANFWHTLGCGIIMKARGYSVDWLPRKYAPYMDVCQEEIDESTKAVWAKDSFDLALRAIEKITDKADELEEEKEERKDGGEDKDRGGGQSEESDGGDESNKDAPSGSQKPGDANPHSVDDDDDDSGKGAGNGGVGDMTDEDLDDACDVDVDGDADIEDIADETKKAIEEAAQNDIAKNNRYIPNPNALAADCWVKPGNRDNQKALYKQNRDVVAKQIRGLKGKLLNIIRAKSVATVEGGHRRGKLDKSKLAQIPAGNRNVFNVEINGEVLDTAITVLIDLSGSMGSGHMDTSKAHYAKLTAISLGETFSALGIPFELIGFHNIWCESIPVVPGTQRDDYIEYVVFKDFGEKYSKCKERLNAITGRGCNTDGEAVLATAKRLAQRPEARKIMFVVSDGQPAGGSIPADQLYKNLKDNVSLITSSGIEMVGIGIKTDAPKQFYNKSTGAKNIVIDELGELAVTVYRMMKAMLLENRRAA